MSKHTISGKRRKERIKENIPHRGYAMETRLAINNPSEEIGHQSRKAH